MIPEPDPIYYGTVHFNGAAFELYRSKWKDRRTVFVRWYVKHEGQPESEFHGTRSDDPATAIGHAILASDENAELTDRLYYFM